MSGPLHFIVARVLDAIDLAFDALQALWRVAARGAFSPDPRAYRGAHFRELASADVLVQRLELNAAEIDEVRKIIALDAQRYLPLTEQNALYDLAGPIDTSEQVRQRPERTFLAAIVRAGALEAHRKTKHWLWSTPVEAFTFTPPDAQKIAFRFIDGVGAGLRRRRRALTALALVVFSWSVLDFGGASMAALETRALAAEAARVNAERALRLAQRDIETLTGAKTVLGAIGGAPLGDVNAHIGQVALRLPSDAEVHALRWEGDALVVQGAAHTPAALELELRRAFAGADIAFATMQPGPPTTFETRISQRTEPAP